MITAGIIALGLAAALAFLGYQQRQRHRRILLTETTTSAELAALHGAAADAAGDRVFAEPAELEGVAVAGPGGLVTSELAEVKCVWHRHKVTHKYRDRYTDSKGNRRTRTRHETVAKHASTDPFYVEDSTGRTLVIAPDRIDKVRKVQDRWEEADPRANRTELSVGKFSMSIPKGGDRSLGYKYEEWALKPGDRIYVLGEATDVDGELAIREPQGKGELLVSTRSEEQLIASTKRQSKLLTWGAAAAAVAGPVLLVIGLLTR
jgi:E3 Ubiquitin ligase